MIIGLLNYRIWKKYLQSVNTYLLLFFSKDDYKVLAWIKSLKEEYIFWR